MKDIPIDEMSRERLLMEYKHYVNATELKKNMFIEWASLKLTTMANGNMYEHGYIAALNEVVETAKEML